MGFVVIVVALGQEFLGFSYQCTSTIALHTCVSHGGCTKWPMVFAVEKLSLTLSTSTTTTTTCTIITTLSVSMSKTYKYLPTVRNRVGINNVFPYVISCISSCGFGVLIVLSTLSSNLANLRLYAGLYW